MLNFVEDMLGQKLCRVSVKSIFVSLDYNIEIIKIEIDSLPKSNHFRWSQFVFSPSQSSSLFFYFG